MLIAALEIFRKKFRKNFHYKSKISQVATVKGVKRSNNKRCNFHLKGGGFCTLFKVIVMSVITFTLLGEGVTEGRVPLGR
ncbi:hypothetical protein AFK49_011350 [Corynebacterium ulcerans]|nr:hypothetical protein AFK49_011350 [Corynebacterium ulcerans]